MISMQKDSSVAIQKYCIDSFLIPYNPIQKNSYYLFINYRNHLITNGMPQENSEVEIPEAAVSVLLLDN